jgi:type IV pilus assembly protein PilB
VEAARADLSLPEGWDRPRLGELLLREGLLTPDLLEEALHERELSGRRLGQVVVELGYVSSGELARLLAQQHGLEYLDLDATELDPAVAKLLPEKFARLYGALPVRLLGPDEMLVAVADPTNVVTSDDLRMALGMNVCLAVVDAMAIEERISRFYRIDVHFEPEEAEDISEGNPDSATAVRLVNELITRAIDGRASDIHFEPSSCVPASTGSCAGSAPSPGRTSGPWSAASR